LPRIATIINAVKDSTWFSTFDLSSGYWQTRMCRRDGSDLKTAFITEQGTFCWNVLPFGLRNAGATMQRLVDSVVGDLLWESVAVYVDDAVCFTRGSFATHIKDLRKFFTRIRKAGLHIKPSKCFLARHEVTLLGHVVNGTTRSPTPFNIAAVRDYGKPTARKQLHTFLGLASYFREYVPYFADAAAPLYDLLKSGQRIDRDWSTTHDAAFAKVKLLHLADRALAQRVTEDGGAPIEQVIPADQKFGQRRAD
jgi:hypothetical protein